MMSVWRHRFMVAGALAAFAAVGAGAARPWSVALAVSLHTLFAVMMILAARSSRTWAAGPRPFPDSGFPSLRMLAWLAPAAILIQIALGAAYRNEMLGLVPHVSWAFLAAIVALVQALFVLTQDQRHEPLRRWAMVLLGATGLQVLLGVLAFVARLNESGPGPLTGAVHAHVGTGTLVLGVSTAMSTWILRDAVPEHAAAPAGTGRPQ